MNLNQALIVLGEYALKLRLAEDRVATLEREVEQLKAEIETPDGQMNIRDLFPRTERGN